MIIKFLEFTGIVIGVMGLIVLYKYNIAPIYKKESENYLYTENESEEMKKKEAKIQAHYKRMSLIGFIMSLGSMLIAIWVLALK